MDLPTKISNPPTGISRLPTEIFDQILNLCLRGVSLHEKLKLRLVTRHFCNQVTERVLRPFVTHVAVIGNDFSQFHHLLSKWTRPLVQDVELKLEYAETYEELERQSIYLKGMMKIVLEDCKNVRSLNILICKPDNLARRYHDNDLDEDWDCKWEGQSNHPLQRNNYHDAFLDYIASFIQSYTAEKNPEEHRYIQIGFEYWTAFTEECLMACAGRNDGIIVGQRGVDNRMVLQSAHSPDGQPPAARDRPGSYSHFIAQQACRAMRYFLHKYLATDPPGLNPQPRRWRFPADQLRMQNHILRGASTAVVPKSELFVPISIRGPFDTAISALQDATKYLEEATRVGEGYPCDPGESYATEILEAKACITRALAALEPACAAEDALAAAERSESTDDDDDDDEESRRSSTDDGRNGSDDGSGDDSGNETEDDDDEPYRVISIQVADA